MESDIDDARGSTIDPEKARALLRSLSRCVAQEASLSTIAADMAGDGVGIADKTLVSHIDALRKLFVIEDVKDFWHRYLATCQDYLVVYLHVFL